MASRSAEATRNALRLAADVAAIPYVVGWVDISSPNLVDLIEDLLGGPGGSKLKGLRSGQLAAEADPLPLARGKSTIAGRQLELWLNVDDQMSTEHSPGATLTLRRLPQFV